jgi:hypothetical protein
VKRKRDWFGWFIVVLAAFIAGALLHAGVGDLVHGDWLGLVPTAAGAALAVLCGALTAKTLDVERQWMRAAQVAEMEEIDDQFHQLMIFNHLHHDDRFHNYETWGGEL